MTPARVKRPEKTPASFEAGLFDRYAAQHVKAVVTWIIPAQLARVTGDGSWLGSSPRYVLEDGKLRHTGRVNWTIPLPANNSAPPAPTRYRHIRLLPVIEGVS